MKVLTVKEVAQILSTTEGAVRARIKRGQLPARKMGWRVVILAEDLEAYLKNLPPASRKSKGGSKDE